MKRRPILTLTTDFGADGPYVAAVKGVILGLAPDAQLVDVSHAVRPQDVRGGAFVLGGVIDAFPAGTVHLAVIDPGVGTERAAVAVRAESTTGGHWFVGPDNGLIPLAVGDRPIVEVRALTNPAHRRARVSATFHGRDLFAPAAAHLLNGGSSDDLGHALPESGLVRLEDPPARREGDGWIGSVDGIDPFGNIVTNLRIDRIGPGPWITVIGPVHLTDFVRTYGERSRGDLVTLEGSSGRLEIAEVQGDAARRLGIEPGATVRLFKSMP